MRPSRTVSRGLLVEGHDGAMALPYRTRAGTQYAGFSSSRGRGGQTHGEGRG